MLVWLDVSCPVCQAKKGEFCILLLTGGTETIEPHPQRREVFAAAMYLKEELEKNDD